MGHSKNMLTGVSSCYAGRCNSLSKWAKALCGYALRKIREFPRYSDRMATAINPIDGGSRDFASPFSRGAPIDRSKSDRAEHLEVKCPCRVPAV